MTQDDNAVETEIFDFDKMVSVLEQARRGLRSDVQLLVDGLDELAVLVPLAKSMSDIPVGVTQELGEEVTLSPHLLPDPEGNWHVALFSDPDALRTVGEHLDWNTSDGELEFCTLPLRVGLELALQLMEDHKVQSVVFNPGDPT